MSKPDSAPPAARDSLSVEIGGWFRAHATGLGVIAVPLLLLLAAGLALVRAAL